LSEVDAQIANYTLWLAILTGALVIATLSLGVVTACGIRRQYKDTRILQRAYVGVKPGGIHLLSTGDKLLGHFIIENAGNLPANNVRWVSRFQVDTDRDRRSFPIHEDQFKGEHYLPPKSRMTFGTPGVEVQSAIAVRDGGEPTCYLYVWGVVRYFDGFQPRRETRFCHRYDFRQTRDLGVGVYELPKRKGRYHQYGNKAD
jgi:hypothetical protein